MTRQRATRLMGQAARHSPAIRFRSVESVRTSAMYLLCFRRRIVAQLPRLTTISLTKVRVLSISIRLTRALTTALPGTTRYSGASAWITSLCPARAVLERLGALDLDRAV